MAVINARNLQRNNTLVENGYSQHFEYNEAMLTGKGLIGIGIAVSAGGCVDVGVKLGSFAMAVPKPSLLNTYYRIHRILR
jgi:hypothetical protein